MMQILSLLLLLLLLWVPVATFVWLWWWWTIQLSCCWGCYPTGNSEQESFMRKSMDWHSHNKKRLSGSCVLTSNWMG